MIPNPALLQLTVPAVTLLAAYLLIPHVAALPLSLSGLRHYGPYFVIAIGIAVSVAFQRGRALFALLTLAAAQLARQLYLQPGSSPAAAYSAFAALCVFVPFNLAALSLLEERGIFNRHGLQRIAILLAQIAFCAGILRWGKAGFASAVYATVLETKLFAASPVPQLGLLAVGLALSVAFVAWLYKRTTIDLGLASAILAFGLAANGVTSVNAFETFIAAGALVVTVAVMQDTFRMAFRDELTGLPSRRALNERLARLPRRFATAMIDVDRFKGLNDRFGHDVGDQVLKLVATRLARVGGGGRIYRYGGEEFTVLFPGKSADEALPHLEALRRDIAEYKLSLRDPERTEVPTRAEKKKRGEGSAVRPVSVTISIGVADREDRATRPEEVIQAADQALYRAKHRGRNQVSR
jgi:diguanylate cyclase (GGDEF)-like protein